MKKCGICKTNQDDSNFHKRKASIDGLSAKCRGCQKAYDKARASHPHRVKARAEYAQTEAGLASHRKASRKWQSRNKGQSYEITKAYRKNNPNKYRAHRKIAYAIKIGDLVRMPCETCGATENIHGHHDDYSRPLNVRWLCSKHHNEWHKENGEGLNP